MNFCYKGDAKILVPRPDFVSSVAYRHRKDLSLWQNNCDLQRELKSPRVFP